jgi:polyhydroxyalkanoate synthesis regulator phasin
MLDTVRRYVEAGMGALSSKRAEDLAKVLVKRGEARKEQVAKVARDLAEWSKKSRDRMAEVVQREVKKQVEALGLATKSDLESLKRRVKSLESKAGASPKTSSSRKGAGSSRKGAASTRAKGAASTKGEAATTKRASSTR